MIFIHCMASFTLMWVPKGLGVAYMLMIVHEIKSFIYFIFYCVYSFLFATDVWPRYSDTAIISSVSEMTSWSTAFEHSQPQFLNC